MAPGMSCQTTWSEDTAHCQVTPVTPPSGSARTAVRTLPTAGCAGDTAKVPGSLTLVTLIVTVMVLPPPSSSRAMTDTWYRDLDSKSSAALVSNRPDAASMSNRAASRPSRE